VKFQIRRSSLVAARSGRRNKTAACHARARSADVTPFINWHWRKETISYHTLKDSTNLDLNFARDQQARARNARRARRRARLLPPPVSEAMARAAHTSPNSTQATARRVASPARRRRKAARPLIKQAAQAL
jgi:hypothetical protein